MKIEKKLGFKIKQLRNKIGISQEELASMCNLHRTYISSVELGKRNVSIKNIEKIALSLNVEIFELLK